MIITERRLVKMVWGCYNDMMQRKVVFLTLGFSFFFLFILFSYLVHKNLFVHFDFNTTVRLQDRIPRRFDGYQTILSDIGAVTVMSVILLIVLLYIRKITGIVLLFCFGIFHFIELFGKTFVDHAPPPQFMLRTEHFINFPQFYVREEFSYPSGHAGRTALLSSVIIYLLIRHKKLNQTQKIIGIGIVVMFDIAMFVSRIYLGEHWTTDVIGGALLGLSLGILSMVFL